MQNKRPGTWLARRNSQESLEVMVKMTQRNDFGQLCVHISVRVLKWVTVAVFVSKALAAVRWTWIRRSVWLVIRGACCMPHVRV